MAKQVEMWILDDSGEELECPSCGVDLRKDALDAAFQMNKKRRWSGKLSFKCQFCKKIVGFEVSWIPEWIRKRAPN